ncbi:hypothetical protein BRC81_05615 [Halobacteriales archaeon QS_1_68_20]|nr:MAG: hypothetical protein BRC81_05615 [Halobacteriales archaeon QS_1_68_20]
MSEIKIGDIAYLYFLINQEVDRGSSPDVSEVRDAFAAEETMELLKQYIDPSRFEPIDEEGFDAMFKRYYIPDETDLLVEDNGFLYLSANLMDIIQSGEWNDIRGEPIDTSSLTLRI